MTTDAPIKQQIYQLIEALPAECLPDILHFINDLHQPLQSSVPTTPAPIYQVQQYAIDTGISDLAAQHDHYLYGVSKDDA